MFANDFRITFELDSKADGYLAIKTSDEYASSGLGAFVDDFSFRRYAYSNSDAKDMKMNFEGTREYEDEDGKYYVVHHTRFDNDTEYHSPRAHQFLLNREGWPCLLPYQTQGETVSETGYAMDEMVGRYYLVLQDTTVTGRIPAIAIAYLLQDGRVYLENGQGNWTMEAGSYYMSITLDGQAFQGVFCRMPDEAGNECMVFSAVGANESLWGVRDMTWQP
jgi:beta-xylosidase